jgi:hypothetical protein
MAYDKVHYLKDVERKEEARGTAVYSILIFCPV